MEARFVRRARRTRGLWKPVSRSPAEWPGLELWAPTMRTTHAAKCRGPLLPYRSDSAEARSRVRASPRPALTNYCLHADEPDLRCAAREIGSPGAIPAGRR